MANTGKTREARFGVIETLLLWEGQVDNERLRAVLEIQAVQASRALAEYAAANSGVVSRKSPRGPYEASASLTPTYSTGTIEEYLSLIRETDQLGGVIEDARVDLTAPTPKIFSTVLQACKARVGLAIDYRSMTTPAGGTRLIFPHAIVRAGRRWHIRAWCAEREDYRDFVIGRVRSASLTSESKTDVKENDADWNKRVALVLGAHPALNAEQSRIIRDEYFDGAVSRRLTVRSCLLSYVIQDIRAAIDPKRETPPDFQLVVSNMDSLQSYLFPSSGQ